MSHTYDPTSPRALEREHQRHAEVEQRKRLAKAERIKWLMSNPRGRQVMWDLLADASPWAQTFSTNAMQMAFNEGKRSVGIDLLAYLQLTCPERYFEMLKEHQKNERRSDDRIDTN
jgi:hypothetical protein